MKKKLIIKLRDLNLKAKKNSIVLNHPNGYLIKKKFNNEFFYSKRWQSSKNLINDYNYINKIYEKNLTYLTIFLNTFHKVNFPKQYWRILIGTWLYNFICVVFGRWNSLRELNAKYKKINIEVLKYNSENFIPYGNEDFKYFREDDNWNSYIFFEIINNFKFNSISKDIKKKNLTFESTKKEIYKRLTLRNYSFKNQIIKIFQRVLLKYNSNLEYFIFDTYQHNLNEIKINFFLNKKPLLFKSLKFDDLYPSLVLAKEEISNKRNIDNKSTKNNFDYFLSNFCKKNIPKCYLEYFDLTGTVLEKYLLPKKPRVIFSTLGVAGRSTLMDMYTANKILSGTKLVMAQHGGNYGQHKVHWPTIHEHKISHRFLSWGLRSENKNKPLGIIKKNLKKIKYNKNNKLIIFEMRPRNLFSQSLKINSSAINSSLYIQKICDFFSNLKDKEILSELRVKLHYTDFGLDDKDLLLKSNNKIRFVDPTINTKLFHNKAKLVIHTFAGTGHLEAMALNMPHLIFFVNDINLLKQKTKKYFIEFKKLGIFHDNPISLINKLKKISKDPGKWWFSNEVQLIRKKYANEFAILNKNLVNDIIKNLKEI